jgi:hypothetical protein
MNLGDTARLHDLLNIDRGYTGRGNDGNAAGCFGHQTSQDSDSAFGSYFSARRENMCHPDPYRELECVEAIRTRIECAMECDLHGPGEVNESGQTIFVNGPITFEDADHHAIGAGRLRIRDIPHHAIYLCF